MDDSKQDYDTFEQYKNNQGVYEKIKSELLDEYDSFPNVVLGEQTENIHSITKDCLRLKKYLMNFRNKEICKKQNCCQYINYLLNKRVREDYGSKESIFKIYNNFMNDENNNNEIMNFCLPEINYMDLDKYNKINKLYKAYYICKFYISNKHDMRCYRAESCIRAYNNMTEYIKQSDTKFCKTLKGFKGFLEAHKAPLASDCYSSFSVLLSHTYDCPELLPKSEEMTASMESPNGESELPGALGEPSEEQRQETSEVGSLGVRAPGLRASAIGGPEGGNDTGETANLIPTQSDSNDINAESPSAKTPTPVGTIIGTSLGFVLPLITIYRFTPLGNWVNTKILGRDRLMDNMKKNELEFLLNSAQTQDMYSGDTKYRIKYNSALNE
ncbi:Plasmodium vivax Vir protein, putative [Plasmodium vivax]|uniref:Vir protein, putative n=1 Tax=Plasmodium vivax TaxID=5855 RepID=A0A1G4E6T1_PLAVI|nr:Plasmodium vivax Vir protein, putative [Plasmodium vivax]SCA82102.1 Plasmodium vivax Vir protein, putative [Plasmodium vivax]